MKYIKTFEKVKRTFNVGDIVVWNRIDSIILSKTIGVARYSINTNYGDLCEITEVKGQKELLYVKLYNKDKNVYVNKYFDDRGRISNYNSSGHWIEAARWYITKPENFNWTIFTAIQYQKIDIIKKLVKNINNININNIGGNNIYTPLLLAGFINNLEIIEIVIDAGANWNEKYNNSNKDFFYFMSDENKKSIIKKYPKKYQNYLAIKDSEKYNL